MMRFEVHGGGDAKSHDVEEAETDLTNPLKSMNVKHHMLFTNFNYNQGLEWPVNLDCN
jgi:hypothetical protein